MVSHLAAGVVSGAALALAACIVAAGAVLQGSVGFGMSLFSAPLLTLIDPDLVPGPLLMAALSLTLLMTWRDRRSMDISGVKWAIGGRVVGTLAGALVLTLVSSHALSLLFGALVLAAVAMTAAGMPVAPKPRALLGAGVLSGFMGTTSAIGGPPIAMLYQRADGPRVRGTLSGYFVLGASMSLVALGVIGKLGHRELVHGVTLLPGVLVGFVLSGRLTRWLDAGRTRAAVLAVSAVAAVIVIARAVL
jgi:uncharacterized protein